MLRIGLFAATLATNVLASDVKQASIRFIGNTYQYEFTVEVSASEEAVRAVVTDYDNLQRINNNVVSSEILERYDERRLKRRMLVNHCLLVFCFDLLFVEDIEHFDDGKITTTVLPAESNLKRGYSIWRIASISDEVTRISVDAEQEPAFWIPPVIGPIIFRRAFMKEVRETARNIEHEANDDAAE